MTTKAPFDLGERTFQFACEVVQFCRKLSVEPGVVRQIAWQLADAGTSIAANYAEAKGSYSRREFAAKNAIVLKEARESRLWLRLIIACKLTDEVERSAALAQGIRRTGWHLYRQRSASSPSADIYDDRVIVILGLLVLGFHL